METIKVYALDGSRQCSGEPGLDLAAMAQELGEAGVDVVSSYKKLAPQPVPTVCGAPTGMANVYEIPMSELALALSLPRAYQVWLFDTKTVEVYKFDGTIQCQPGGEIPLSALEKELAGADVKVISSHKDRIGIVPALCGLPTGAINVAVINAADFPRAQKLDCQLLSVSPDAIPVKAESGQFREHLRAISRLQALSAGFSPESPNEPLPGLPKIPVLPRPIPSLDPFPIPRPWPLPQFPRHAHVLITELPGHSCRVIRPGDMVTLDLRFERFNISLDANGVITHVGFY